MPTPQQSPRRAGARQTVVAILVPAQQPQGMIRAMCHLLYVNRYAALEGEDERKSHVDLTKYLFRISRDAYFACERAAKCVSNCNTREQILTR